MRFTNLALILLIATAVISCGKSSSGSSSSSSSATVPTSNSSSVTITTPTPPTTPHYSVSTTIPVPYPSGYMVATTDSQDVNTDFCKLNLPVVAYPQSWLGGRPLPAVSNAPFDASIGRAVVIKDIMLDNNPGFVNGCNSGAGSLKGEITKTLTRIANLNSGYVFLTQWTVSTINPDGTYSIPNPESLFGPISDSNLSYFVSESHRLGLKVVLWNQIQGFRASDGKDMPTPSMNTDNLNKWFDAFETFMINRAPFYNKIGVDVWDGYCSSCDFSPAPNMSRSDNQLFYDRNLRVIKSVKSQYFGKMYVQDNPWLDFGSSYMSYIDLIHVNIWSNKSFTIQESDSLTPTIYKNTLGEGISTALRFGKPLFVMGVGIQSRRDALSSPGYLEETGCTAGVGSMSISNTQCIQEGTQTDFSLQSVVIEGQMEYIKSLAKNNIIVVVGDYFMTDAIESKSVFPNIGYTIRNKPAEGIVRDWFKK